jgi:hypothetical protein
MTRGDSAKAYRLLIHTSCGKLSSPGDNLARGLSPRCPALCPPCSRPCHLHKEIARTLPCFSPVGGSVGRPPIGRSLITCPVCYRAKARSVLSRRCASLGRTHSLIGPAVRSRGTPGGRVAPRFAGWKGLSSRPGSGPIRAASPIGFGTTAAIAKRSGLPLGRVKVGRSPCVSSHPPARHRRSCRYQRG